MVGIGTVFLLLMIATAVAIGTSRLKIPYAVGLVVTGLVLRAAHALEPPHLTKELLYTVFLPALLFEAAFHIDFRKFWTNKVAVHALAIPGVAAAIFLTAMILTPLAGALHFVEGFTFQHALVFAALIAATDPVAVVGLFKSLGVPKRLAVLLEGESLLNDGTAIVFFSLILGIAYGKTQTVGSVFIDFIRIVGSGALIGAVIGYGVSKITQRINDPLIEITLTVLSAYGAFAIAEHYHSSGVIATVAAGMFSGNYAARIGMSATTRVAVETFWEYAAFALNSLIFLLIGLEVSFDILVNSWIPILAAWVAVVVARGLVILAVSGLLRPTGERIPWSWSAVLAWGGLRGGLSMVLVLGLAASFAQRDLLIAMTFGVVILSIFVQGLTMPALLHKLKLTGASSEQRAYEKERATLRALTAAAREMDQMPAYLAIHPDVVDRLRREYSEGIRAAEEKVRELHLEQPHWRDEELFTARRHLLAVEKDSIIQSFHKGELSRDVFDHLIEDVDGRILALEKNREEPEPKGPKEGEGKSEEENHPKRPLT